MRGAMLLPVMALFVLAPAVHGDEPRSLQQLIENRCALCHGVAGESVSDIYPGLAAQHPEYLAKQLKDFRAGRRVGAMNEMAADLNDEEIAALAAYFGGKNAAAKLPGDHDLAAVGRYIYIKGNSFSGVPACASCHGPTAQGTHQLPRLAGQHPQYLESQLKGFDKRVRTNDNAVMHTVASKLTDLETRAVSVYIGGLP